MIADSYGRYDHTDAFKDRYSYSNKCGVCYLRNKHIQLNHTERYQILPFEILVYTIHCLNDSLTISVRSVDILGKKC